MGQRQNECLLEKRELVTWGRPEGGGGEKKCKNSYGPGRVVMKIQSVTLNRELWPAIEC